MHTVYEGFNTTQNNNAIRTTAETMEFAFSEIQNSTRTPERHEVFLNICETVK